MTDFVKNQDLNNYIITILGYSKINNDGSRHTNWYPWNRFKDVFLNLGYQCEWVEFEDLIRKDEKRLFITWNFPTCLELYQSGKIKNNDIVFQKLTSLGKGMENINWTNNPKRWCEEWHWPIYRTVEYLYDKGLNIYAFGCYTDINLYKEKKRICQKLKDRIFWITWGGTPFNWEQIKNCQPIMDNLTKDITFVGSKWGVVGRGNKDAWDKYIQPLEQDSNYKFNKYGGIGNKMVPDNEMIQLLQKSKLCPIIHSPSWQAEKGVQDRFYTVFLSGRFGICDNLGAIDIFGSQIKEICTEDTKEYYQKSIYFLQNLEKQYYYIKLIQDKIKKQFNFYKQWENILNNVKIDLNNSNYYLISNINYSFLPYRKSLNFNNDYRGESINNYFNKIFIINLKKDIDKKNKVLKYLQLLNIRNFEFLEAVDGYDQDIIEDYNKLSKKGFITLWEKNYQKKHLSNPKELGCLLSHLKILEIAKERNYRRWLHLEDDVILHKGINHLFSLCMKNIPYDWDIIYFGCIQRHLRNNYLEKENKFIYKANISCGTFAFAVSKTNIDFIINRFKLLNAPVDSIMISELQNILNCYVLKNNIIITKLNNLFIRKSIKDKNEEIDFFKKCNWNNNTYFIL